MFVDTLNNNSTLYSRNIKSTNTSDNKLSFCGDIRKLNVSDCGGDIIERNDYLQSLLNSVHQGNDVTITGYPGTGKSALARSLKNKLVQQGYNIVLLNFREEENRIMTFSEEKLDNYFKELAKINVNGGVLILDDPMLMVNKKQYTSRLIDFIKKFRQQNSLIIVDFIYKHETPSSKLKDKMLQQLLEPRKAKQQDVLTVEATSDNFIKRVLDSKLKKAGFEFDTAIIDDILENFKYTKNIKDALRMLIDVIHATDKADITPETTTITYEDYLKIK